MIFCIILTQSYINFSRQEHQKDVLLVSLRFHPIPPFIFPLQSLQKRAVLTRSHIWKSRFNSVFTSLIEPKLITRCPNVDFLNDLSETFANKLISYQSTEGSNRSQLQLPFLEFNRLFCGFSFPFLRFSLRIKIFHLILEIIFFRKMNLNFK